ncbi:MAG: helix-turn-helix transcriptional regulator, partial [Oscillospiraceae bacterium]|nr:helix-turn-helix transcriptional regulator [Oscillospiraceae bacterium]
MTPLTNKQVGERIRFVREAKGITQEEVAVFLGMTKSNYAKYERGERRKIDREFLLGVAEALGCNVAEINGLSDNDNALPFSESHSQYTSSAKITRQTLKDEERILLSHFGELDEE